MKKIVISMIGALCVSAAYAGDQPVVVVDNGVVLYMTTTSVEDVAAVPVAIPGSQATAPGFVANAVPTGAEADLLYARLLKEAEKRGLRRTELRYCRAPESGIISGLGIAMASQRGMTMCPFFQS